VEIKKMYDLQGSFRNSSIYKASRIPCGVSINPSFLADIIQYSWREPAPLGIVVLRFHILWYCRA